MSVIVGTSALIGLSPGVASAVEPPLSPRTLSIQGEVITYYKYALNRAPDVGGFGYWVNLAHANCYPNFGQVPSGVWNSPEFRARPLTRGQGVQTLYQGLLARTGSSAEIGWWLNAMNNGASWAAVVAGFANSPEYRGRIYDVCRVHAYPKLFITEANQLLTGMTFSMWLRHRTLRMQIAGPYNWTTDGCSVVPDSWLLFDYRVCWRHDWGYRNFGRGLQLDRTATRRKLIDDVLHQDMIFNCGLRYAGGSVKHIACLGQADTIYNKIRQYGGSAFY
jgi:hypothetical protein